MTSDNYTVVAFPQQGFTDNQGNVWYIDGNTGRVAESIRPDDPNHPPDFIDPNTANVDALAWVNGSVWQQAHPPWDPSHVYWWQRMPDGSWGSAQTVSPLRGHPSPDNSTVDTTSVTAFHALTDQNGDIWTLNANHQVVMNGFVDDRTDHVDKIAINNGTLWQEAVPLWGNGNQYWFQWNGSGWDSGTRIASVPIDRAWIGGGNNNANDPAHWSPFGTPQAGDHLSIDHGTMNVTQDSLVNDTLTLNAQTGSNAPITLNFSGPEVHAFVSEGFGFGPAIINLAENTQWIGGFSTSPYTSYPGETVHGDRGAAFSNATTVIGATVKFDVPVVNNGTFTVNASHGGPPTLEFVHGVTEGQSIKLNGGLYGTNPATLRIDDPTNFKASVEQGWGETILQGISADSYDLKGEMLTLYSGNRPVEHLRFALDTTTGNNNATDFGVSQVGKDIDIHSDGNRYTAGGTLLPVHT